MKGARPRYPSRGGRSPFLPGRASPFSSRRPGCVKGLQEKTKSPTCFSQAASPARLPQEPGLSPGASVRLTTRQPSGSLFCSSRVHPPGLSVTNATARHTQGYSRFSCRAHLPAGALLPKTLERSCRACFRSSEAVACSCPSLCSGTVPRARASEARTAARVRQRPRRSARPRHSRPPLPAIPSVALRPLPTLLASPRPPPPHSPGVTRPFPSRLSPSHPQLRLQRMGSSLERLEDSGGPSPERWRRTAWGGGYRDLSVQGNG